MLDRREQDGDQPHGNHPIFISAVVPMRFNLMADLNVKNARFYEQSATAIYSTTDRGRRVRRRLANSPAYQYKALHTCVHTTGSHEARYT